MYRQIFTATETNNQIPINIPQEWYGMDVEVIAFPIARSFLANNDDVKIEENNKKREEMLKKYSFNMSDFKFNRDEANDYD